MMGVLSKKIMITGAVQGVGFRPFVYKIAQQFDLLGEVYNDSIGVVIITQCTQTQHRHYYYKLHPKDQIVVQFYKQMV